MKKLVVNLDETGRNVESEGQITKPVVWKTYWFFEPVGSDNSPLGFVPKADRAGFGPNSASRIMRLTDSSGVCKHREFHLSVCGKDKYKVMFGVKRDGSDKIEAETYEVWRRVYFSVRYMRTKFLFDFSAIDTEYRKHGIWPVKIDPAGGARVPHTRILETRQAGFDLGPAVTEPHLEARFVLVDRMWISEWQTYTIRTGQLSKTITFPHDVWPEGEFIRGVIEGVDVTTLATRSGKTVTLNIGSNAALATRVQTRKVEGSITVKLRQKVLNGSTEPGPTGRIVISSRTGIGPELRDVGPRQITMIHEMGHGLKMVVDQIQGYNEYNGNPIASQLIPNPTYYSNGGGHCHTAASGTSPNYKNGSCVIFHAENPNRQSAFCGSCAPIIKRTNMNRDDMPWAES